VPVLLAAVAVAVGAAVVAAAGAAVAGCAGRGATQPPASQPASAPGSQAAPAASQPSAAGSAAGDPAAGAPAAGAPATSQPGSVRGRTQKRGDECPFVKLRPDGRPVVKLRGKEFTVNLEGVEIQQPPAQEYVEYMARVPKLWEPTRCVVRALSLGRREMRGEILVFGWQDKSGDVWLDLGEVLLERGFARARRGR
jgi:hypothetical protein